MLALGLEIDDRMGSSTYPDALLWAGMFFYSFLVLGHIMVMVIGFVRKIDQPTQPLSIYGYLAIPFLILRVAHLVLAYHNSNATFYVSRIAFLIFLSAFSVALYAWMLLLGISSMGDRNFVTHLKKFLIKLKWGFLIGNIVVWVVYIIIIILYATQANDRREGNVWYEISIALLMVLMFLLGLGFVVYGVRLYVQSDRATEGVQRTLLRASILATIVAICFAIRVAFFLYRPITSKYLDPVGFMCGAYYVPELLPMLIALFIHMLRVFENEEQKDKEERARLLYEEQRSSRGRKSSIASARPHLRSQSSSRISVSISRSNSTSDVRPASNSTSDVRPASDSTSSDVRPASESDPTSPVFAGTTQTPRESGNSVSDNV